MSFKRRHHVARVQDLSPGKGIKVTIGKMHIALFNYRGRYYAMQNFCPHQNADLADGYLRDGQVFCPLHNWAFDLASGAYAFNPELKIKTFPVVVEQDSIFILID